MESSSPPPEPARRPGDAADAGAADAALPRAPRLPRRREPPTRKTALTAAGIVQAAIEVLDDGGLAGLSMRRVAARLDTSAASLYAHVSGKDELLELVFDELVGRVSLPVPDPARWREQVHEMVRELHATLAAHRDAALAGLGRIPTTPKVLNGAEALSAVMLAGGLTERVAALGLDQLILFVCASALEQSLVDNSGLSPEEVVAYFGQVHDFYAHLPAERFPALARLAPDMTGPDGDARFEFGVDVLLAGFEAASQRERSGPVGR